MYFIPDLSKQAGEIMFSKQFREGKQPLPLFGYSQGQIISTQNHLGLYPDDKIEFQHQLQETIPKKFSLGKV